MHLKAKKVDFAWYFPFKVPPENFNCGIINSCHPKPDQNICVLTGVEERVNWPPGTRSAYLQML